LLDTVQFGALYLSCGAVVLGNIGHFVDDSKDLSFIGLILGILGTLPVLYITILLAIYD